MTQPSPSPARAGAITAVLGLLSLFPPLATDMYLAGIGDLAHSFNATHTAAELSLSLFFLGLCAGQLLIGPLTDGFGRKVPLLIGTVLFVVTSVILPLVNDIAVFNALRFLQAVGASAGMVVGRAIVRDLYHGRRAAQVMTILVMLLTIGPIVSPTLGGVLLEAFGWRSIFATMATIGAVAFALSLLVLPETLPASKRTNHPFVNGTRRAKTLLSQPGFLIMALVGGLSQAGMFAFITGSSGVFQGVYGLSTFGFGLMFAGIAAALIVFGRINSVLLRRFSPDEILKRGLPAFVLSAAVLTLMSGTTTLWMLAIPLWFTVGMVGLLSANAMAMAMELAETGAGMGSALLGAIQFAVAFTVSTGVALGGTATALPMCLGLLIPAILATVLYFASGRPAEAETSQQEAA